MPETPKEKATRIGAPIIPSTGFPDLPPANPTIAVCGECGLELKRIMGYV